MTVRVCERDPVPNRLFGDALQAHVDRQLEFAVGAVLRHPAQRSDDVAARVDRYARARDTAVEQTVVRRLYARLADHLT